MNDFYAGLGHGQPVAVALRAAKLAAIRRGAPALSWAAFTVVGDPLARVALRELAPRARVSDVGRRGTRAALVAFGVARRRRNDPPMPRGERSVSGADLRGARFSSTLGTTSGVGRAAVEALATRGRRRVRRFAPGSHAYRCSTACAPRVPPATSSSCGLDLADLSSVRQAAAQFLATGRPLDVLMNNAGVAGIRSLSKDGFDLTYATNHIGPFLLTNLLLPSLKRSSQGRIVNVSSVAHTRVAR